MEKSHDKWFFFHKTMRVDQRQCGGNVDLLYGHGGVVDHACRCSSRWQTLWEALTISPTALWIASCVIAVSWATCMVRPRGAVTAPCVAAVACDGGTLCWCSRSHRGAWRVSASASASAMGGGGL